MFEIRFYSDDDRDPNPEDAIAVTRTARKVPDIGHGVTLVTRDGTLRRYRVVDVDHGYTAQHAHNTFTESTVAVYVMDADDPRRLGK